MVNRKDLLPKYLSVFFIITLSLLPAGCADKPTPNTLTVTMSLGEHEWQIFRNNIFPAFEKRHNVEVRAFQIESGQLVMKLEALQKAGKSEIDLFAQDNMNLAILVDKGLVLELSEYEGRIPPEIPANMIKACQFNGKLMFMPFRPNVQIAYYNEAAFKKYNLKPPRTWDELITVAKQFKAEEGEGRVLFKAFGGNPTATQIYEFILQGGGRPFSLNDAGCVKTFTFLQKLWPSLSEESIRAKWDTTNDILARQKAYLAQNWPFGVAVLIQEYNLNFIKTYSGWRGPAGEYHVIGGDVFGIPKNTGNRNLALEFIRYVHSKEVQNTLVSKLAWPSIRRDTDARVEPPQRPHYESVKAALEHGAFRENVKWWPAYAKNISEAFRKIVIQNKPVKETLDLYKERLKKDKALYK